MARRDKRNKAKQGSLMHEHNSLWGGNKTTPTLGLANQLKIVDKKSTKHFGILLSTQQSVEEFQKKSDMLKPFTTEYQYHYWALVARIKVDDEVLDIGIPTVMFNYKQTVSGAAVSFHLTDVEEASNRNQAVAEAIAGVIVDSAFGQYLQNKFGEHLEWMNVPMNTCHVHPGSLSSFSGTDYAKTINDPGIVYPLVNPVEQPSFSSIICHVATEGNVGKVVRTEYRFANKVENDIVYQQGSCLAYWKGYMVPGYTIPGHKIKIPLIQSLFLNKEYDIKEDVIVPDTPKNAYINTDGPVVLQDNVLIAEIFSEFDKIEFSPYTEDILAERIVKPTYGSAYGTGGYWRGNTYYPSTHSDPKQVGNTADEKIPVSEPKLLVEYREALITAGYSASAVYSWDWSKCKQAYENYKNMSEIVKDREAAAEPEGDKMSLEEMIKYMIANGIPAAQVKGKTIAQLEDMFEELVEKLEAETIEMLEDGSAMVALDGETGVEKIDFKANEKVRKFLIEYGIDEEILNAMTNDDIVVLLEELNW